MDGSTVVNPILVDDEEDKENSAPTTTTTPQSERPTEPPRLLRSCLFGTRLKNVLDSVQNHCENEFEKYCLNGGERYCLIDEDIVVCKCTWFYGDKRCGDYR